MPCCTLRTREPGDRACASASSLQSCPWKKQTHSLTSTFVIRVRNRKKMQISIKKFSIGHSYWSMCKCRSPGIRKIAWFLGRFCSMENLYEAQCCLTVLFGSGSGPGPNFFLRYRYRSQKRNQVVISYIFCWPPQVYLVGTVPYLLINYKGLIIHFRSRIRINLVFRIRILIQSGQWVSNRIRHFMF